LEYLDEGFRFYYQIESIPCRSGFELLRLGGKAMVRIRMQECQITFDPHKITAIREPIAVLP
jgi:hypothetical protein